MRFRAPIRWHSLLSGKLAGVSSTVRIRCEIGNAGFPEKISISYATANAKVKKGMTDY